VKLTVRGYTVVFTNNIAIKSKLKTFGLLSSQQWQATPYIYSSRTSITVQVNPKPIEPLRGLLRNSKKWKSDRNRTSQQTFRANEA